VEACLQTDLAIDPAGNVWVMNNWEARRRSGRRERLKGTALRAVHARAHHSIKLTLTGVAPSSIVFADRPVRAAGHALTSHLLAEWATGSNSFAKNPPNATVSVFSEDGSTVRDAVVVLKTPKLEGERLTFDVQVLEGDLAGADGAASLFIDTANFEVSALQSMFPSTNWPPSMRH